MSRPCFGSSRWFCAPPEFIKNLFSKSRHPTVFNIVVEIQVRCLQYLWIHFHTLVPYRLLMFIIWDFIIGVAKEILGHVEPLETHPQWKQRLRRKDVKILIE